MLIKSCMTITQFGLPYCTEIKDRLYVYSNCFNINLQTSDTPKNYLSFSIKNCKFYSFENMH